MKPDAILAELELPWDTIPEEAILEAMEQPEAVTPGLLAILEEILADPAAYLDQVETDAHLYALYLLAQFREPRALPLALDLLRLPQDQQDALLGDLVTEGMPSILASLCVDAPSTLEAAAVDAGLDPYVRAAAMDALLVLAFQGHLPEDRFMATFDRILSAFEARGGEEDRAAWACLADVLEIAGLDPFLPRIQDACARGVVDLEIVDPGDLAADISRHKAHKRRRFLRTHHLVDDALLSLEDLPWLDPRNEAWPEEEAANIPEVAQGVIQSVIAGQGPRRLDGPSRNGLCPCGSGKKFKRCCGA
jgi:hypothetical protein